MEVYTFSVDFRSACPTDTAIYLAEALEKAAKEIGVEVVIQPYDVLVPNEN